MCGKTLAGFAPTIARVRDSNTNQQTMRDTHTHSGQLFFRGSGYISTGAPFPGGLRGLKLPQNYEEGSLEFSRKGGSSPPPWLAETLGMAKSGSTLSRQLT